MVTNGGIAEDQITFFFSKITILFYCAGQQHSDNVLTMAKSPMPLEQFLQGWF